MRLRGVASPNAESFVAPSRLAAVKYKQEIDNYIDTKQYPGIHTLVAFSNEIEDDGFSAIIEYYLSEMINLTKLILNLELEYNILK